MKIKFPPKLVRFVTEKGLTIVAFAALAAFVVSLFFVQKKDVKFINGNFEYEKSLYEYDVAIVKTDQGREEIVIVVYPIRYTERFGLETNSAGKLGFGIEEEHYNMDTGKAYFVTLEQGKPVFRAYVIQDSPIMYSVTLKDLRTKIQVSKETREVETISLPDFPMPPVDPVTASEGKDTQADMIPEPF